MKLGKFVLGAAAAVTLAVTATSASAGGSIKDPRPFSWTGFYAGGHLGAGWGDVDWTREFDGPVDFIVGRVSQNDGNVIGGGQLGVQYQVGNVVAGVEVSLSGTSLSDNTLVLQGNPFAFTSKIENLFMAVGRIGFAHHNWLTYLKGGYASARVELNTSFADTNVHLTSSSKRQGGYVLGAGFEYAVHKNVSLGLEYNYVKLGSGDVFNVETDVSPLSNHRDIDTTMSSVVARINIKLDREREPLK
jgi:outer membrane immunogenic protein